MQVFAYLYLILVELIGSYFPQDRYLLKLTGSLMHKCSCGRDSRTFEACTPMGCSTFVVCTGCSRYVNECACKPT